MSRRLVVMCAVLLMLSVILFMPLRAIVSGEGVSARKVDGIIWDGSIRDLRLGKLPIGDVNARLLVGPLFLGRADILLSRGNAPYRPGFTGTVSRGFGSMSVNNLNATLPVAALFAPFSS